MVLPNTHKIQYAYLDNGFINMLIVGGILCFSLMIILLILHFITLLKNNNRFEILLMCILCMYFLCESGMNSIINNVFIIELADVIYHTSPSGVNTKFKTLKHVDDVLWKRRKRI